MLNIESELRRLESGYRQALSGAVAAKARFFARASTAGATPASIARARREWQSLEHRRRAVARAMRELEAMEQTIL